MAEPTKWGTDCCCVNHARRFGAGWSTDKEPYQVTLYRMYAARRAQGLASWRPGLRQRDERGGPRPDQRDLRGDPGWWNDRDREESNNDSPVIVAAPFVPTAFLLAPFPRVGTGQPGGHRPSRSNRRPARRGCRSVCRALPDAASVAGSRYSPATRFGASGGFVYVKAGYRW